MEEEAEGCNSRDKDFDALVIDAKDEDSLEASTEEDTGLKVGAYCH